MIKITNYGFVEQGAVDLLKENGAVIEYDGESGAFHRLPGNCQMGDLYGGTPGLGDTRIYRDISFGDHIVQMGVSDGRGGQFCDRLKVIKSRKG